MADQQFKRGAIPTPRHRLLAAEPFRAPFAAPAQAAWVPAKLSMWGNDQYGDCVSAEEAFARACHNPEIFISDKEVIRWATVGGFRDGAMLDEVMAWMQRTGFQQDGHDYGCGKPLGVDYSNESVLQAAIAQGPVKIAIAADALPSGAGNQSGWHATGGGRHPNTDHCVAICGYGPAAWLYQQLNVPLPSGLPSEGYLLYTWKTIGFVDHDWLMGTCVEAWLRQPTTVIDHAPDPVPPPPPPGPGPTPGPCQNIWDCLKPSLGKEKVTQLRRAWNAASERLKREGGGAAAKDLHTLFSAIGTDVLPPVPWSLILAVVAIILSDVLAGKTVYEIVQDVLAYLTS